MNRRELIRNTLLVAGAVTTEGALAESAMQGATKPRTPEASAAAAHETEIAHRKDTSQRMPNVLWICADQQRADTIHALGNKHIRTPNLDALASQSVTFTNAFCQTPICAPSRGSFLTGRYPRQTNLKSNAEYIRSTEKLVPRILADQGYDCGLAGKLHLSPCDHHFVEKRIDDGYRVFEWSHDISDNWPGHNRWRNWLAEQGVTWPVRPRQASDIGVWGVPVDPKYTQTAWCSGEAIKFIKTQKKDQPWMMSVNIYQPHAPYFPTEAFLKRYDPDTLPSPAYVEGELESKPSYQKTDSQGAYGGHGKSFVNETDAEHRLTKAAYYAMIEQVDVEVGRMTRALDELGMAEDTIVIYMSDHGDMLGDHGIYEKGPYFYDCLTRVPLIIRWPGKYKAGLKSDALVELVDIVPTLMDAAGLTIPAGIQGSSLTPLLTGAATDHRNSVYMEYYDAVAKYHPTPMASCVRTNDWKVTYWQTLGTGELYDMQNDPGEVKNLWGAPTSKGEQSHMMQLLVERMISSTDPLGVHVF